MEWLETAVVVVHILVCLGLVGLVLLQQGKGAEAGASFGGGASQTVFGSQGSGNFLTKSTKYLAIIFFITSISLAVIAKQKSEVSEELIAPAATEQLSLESGSETGNESGVDSAVDGKLESELSEPAAPELE